MRVSDPTLEFGRPAGEAERVRLGEVLSECFNTSVEDTATWFRYAGDTHLRVLRRVGEVVGGLVTIPMGQFWGGRPVSLCGIGGVGIAPWARGGGAATGLMADALREARQAGFALAGLYPATQPVYRRVGFEQAGVRCELRAPLTALPEGRREPAMRPFRPEDLPAVEGLYREGARRRQGWLERGPYVWHRVRFPRGMTTSGYVVEEAGRLEAYVFLARVRRPDSAFAFDLVLTDWAARTEVGWRRLLGFLADHASVGRDVVWHGGPSEPLVALFREQPVATQVVFHWMLRVLDVPAALTARGYPRGLTGALHLEVDDPVLPDNAGRWVLEVHGGEARVRPGGEGTLRCGARGLAALFSGARTATALAAVGALQGSPEALEEAESLFAGPTPCMPDMF